MNAKTDGWESYTDETGRRHWRWPAADRPLDAGTRKADAGPRRQIVLPGQPKAEHPPTPLTGK